jgi:hypothetical protein
MTGSWIYKKSFSRLLAPHPGGPLHIRLTLSTSHIFSQSSLVSFNSYFILQTEIMQLSSVFVTLSILFAGVAGAPTPKTTMSMNNGKGVQGAAGAAYCTVLQLS